MSLANAREPQRDDVLASVDPFAAHQLQYQRLVQPGNRSKVEGIQALGHREFSQTNVCAYRSCPILLALFLLKQGRFNMERVIFYRYALDDF